MVRNNSVLLMIMTIGVFATTGCTSDSASVIVWDIQEKVRIGNQMGGGPDMFGDLDGLSIGPNGRIYAYDSTSSEIRVFDRRGSYIRHFGGPGAGPGEFGWVWAMTWDLEDNLWIIDAGNQRYSIFDTTGTFIADLRSPVTSRDSQIAGFDLSGYFYDQSAYVDSENIYRREIVRLTREGTRVGEIPLPEFTRQALQMGPLRLPIPYSRQLIMCFDPSGYIWYGINDRYEIFKMTFEGKRTLVIQGSIEVFPLSSSDRDSLNSYIERLKTRYRMASVPGDIIPQTKPIYDGIYLNRTTGEIWVKLINNHDEATVFDIYRSDGRFKGKVICRIPFLSDPEPVILGNEIWFVTEDEMGAQYIVRGVLTLGNDPL